MPAKGVGLVVAEQPEHLAATSGPDQRRRDARPPAAPFRTGLFDPEKELAALPGMAQPTWDLLAARVYPWHPVGALRAHHHPPLRH